MKNVIDEIAAREKQKKEQKVLSKSAEKYKKKITLEKILNSSCECLSDEEKEVVKNIIKNI